jgi:hypothetical protein
VRITDFNPRAIFEFGKGNPAFMASVVAIGVGVAAAAFLVSLPLRAQVG